MSSEAVTERPVRHHDGQVHLVGGRCTSCGTTSFPREVSCARCGGDMDEVELPSEGTVWSWTVQRIAVKPPYAGPQPFEPFVVAYVDLGPLKVESPLFGRPIDVWSIGDEVRIADGDLHPHLAFWFESKGAV
jgi:uncharacterized protein